MTALTEDEPMFDMADSDDRGGAGVKETSTLAGETAELVCSVCGATFVHGGGRGRPPSRCPDCRAKPRERVRSRGRAGRASTVEDDAPQRPRPSRSIETLKKNVHGQLAMLGMAVAVFDAFDAQVIMLRAEAGAEALANLAATNPSIRRALERGIEAAGWGPVLLWGAQMMLPIAAHHGLIRGVPDPALTPPNGRAGASVPI